VQQLWRPQQHLLVLLLQQQDPRQQLTWRQRHRQKTVLVQPLLGRLQAPVVYRRPSLPQEPPPVVLLLLSLLEQLLVRPLLQQRQH
jgi:hypothetical protein